MTDRPAPQKSADAYRTISEVADELNLPQHVLRFWETRFPQVKPLKRAGGRRFYRPEDVALLRAVQALLYGEGYTIRGVQRLLAEHGARHVAEALARSRAMPPREARDGDDDAVPELDPPPARREPDPPPVLRRPVPPSPAPPRPAPTLPALRPAPDSASDARSVPAQSPAAGSAPGAAVHAGGGVSAADRLAAVLLDLDEARRLLASVRST